MRKREGECFISDKMMAVKRGYGNTRLSPLEGQLDEIKISNVQRYEGNFPFPGALSRLTFTQGRVLGDASGNGHTFPKVLPKGLSFLFVKL